MIAMIAWTRTILFIGLVAMWAFDPWLRGTAEPGGLSLLRFFMNLICWIGISLQLILAELNPIKLDEYLGLSEEKESK